MVTTASDLGEPLEPASPAENTPPALPAVSGDVGRRLSLLDLILRGLAGPRKLSRSEQSELAAEERERQRLMSHKVTLEAEAEFYARLIPDELERLNICYRYKKSETSSERVKKVSIRKPFVLREEAIYLHVDTRPEAAPRGVMIKDMADPDVLRNLSLVCGHKVLCKYNELKGFYYVVEREAGVRGIPVHVKYDEILSGRPSSADGLSLPFGIGDSKRAVWRSLAQLQSMLVAGTTGGGKSNFLNVLICTMLRYNSTRRLRLLLVDLKGGVEFSYYMGIPHLLPIPLPAKKGAALSVSMDGKEEPARESAIIEDREDVPAAFHWLVNEGERRLGMLKADHVKHIGEYNYHHPKTPMAHIVCIVDEWADVKLEPKLGKECEELLINIASRFRAVGIHLIICTQTPNKDVISIRVKNVLPARIAFACPNIHSSMLIIGNGRAAGLEPRGRAIFDWGQTQMELQAPLINNQTVDEVVASAIRGQWEEIEVAHHDVTEQEIYTWASRDNDGKLQTDKVWGHFRHRGFNIEDARAFCRGADGKTVVVDASVFKVMPGGPGVARHLEEVKEEPETPDKNPAGGAPKTEE